MAKKDEGYLLDDSGERVKSGSGDYVRSGSYDDEKVTENRMKAAEEKLAQDVQKKLKDDSDSARVSKDAEQGAKAPTSSVKASDGMDESDRRREAAESAPKRQDSAKPKSGVVTKEELAKSGLSLRDYMNKQKGLTRRDGSKTEKTPSKTTTETKPAGLMAKADKPAAGTSSLRDPQQMAKQKEAPAASNKKPEPFEMPITRVLRAIRERGDADLKSRGMAKGGSINGIAKRGLTRCKMV